MTIADTAYLILIEAPISPPDQAIARHFGGRQPIGVHYHDPAYCCDFSAVLHFVRTSIAANSLRGVLVQTMRKANFTDAAGELFEAPQISAEARERRVSEELITDWEQETRRLGHALALMTLDVSAMTGPKWAYRFIIAVSLNVEDSSFLFNGDGFAPLMELPETSDHSVPLLAQLPARYIPVFAKGCIASTLSSVAVRMQGSVERPDGKEELYRAAFIRLSLDASRQRHFAFGAFNCRVADHRLERPTRRPLPSVKVKSSSPGSTGSTR
jgi:hypothetical protein